MLSALTSSDVHVQQRSLGCVLSGHVRVEREHPPPSGFAPRPITDPTFMQGELIRDILRNSLRFFIHPECLSTTSRARVQPAYTRKKRQKRKFPFDLKIQQYSDAHLPGSIQPIACLQDVVEMLEMLQLVMSVEYWSVAVLRPSTGNILHAPSIELEIGGDVRLRVGEGYTRSIICYLIIPCNITLGIAYLVTLSTS